MDNISSLLLKFRRLINDDGDLRKVISEILKEITGIEIKAESIRLKERSIFISCPPAVGSEVFLRKTELISKIREKTKKDFIDIRFC